MESKRITHNCRCAVFVIAQLFFFSCLLTCGCETTSKQQTSSDDYDPQKEIIEKVFRARLPESVRNCKYHFKSYGMSGGIGWGFFEISRADMQYLLDASDYLPDTSVFGRHHSRFDMEKYLEQTGESIAWWKPVTLQKRQYAQKVIDGENVTEFFERITLPVINICVGEIRDDWMGVYFTYHLG